MATKTTYLELTKPDASDKVQVSDINGNMDKIDAAVQGNAEAISGAEARLNIAVQQRDRVWNLLDNSDFRNPVNQRSKTTYTGSGYGIDRWRQWAGSMTVGGNGVTVYESALFQYIEGGTLKNAVHTLAAKKADGTIILYVRNPYEAYAVNEYGLGLGLDGNHAVSLPYDHTFEWAALYEGEYTAETLPAYMPKGYTVEFNECRRYYRQFYKDKHGLIGMYDAPTKYCYVSVNMEDNPMRIPPTLIGSGYFYISGAMNGNTGSDVAMYKADAHKITMRVSPPASISANVYLFNPQFDFGLSADL